MRKIILLICLLTITSMISNCARADTSTEITVTSVPLANVTCNALSFYLDPALGSGYDCEKVPENASSDIPMEIFVYPAHTELKVQEYPLSQTQFPPQLWIYPVERFNELLPQTIPQLVDKLDELIPDGKWSGGELPFLPPIPQRQSFFCHERIISFNGGQGVRFITAYSEGPTPITNKNIIYTFQGLTDDGKYWVAVTFPISSPVLPANYDTLPEGYSQEDLILNYDFYAEDVKAELETMAPESFSPTIQSLDKLIMSINLEDPG